MNFDVAAYAAVGAAAGFYVGRSTPTKLLKVVMADARLNQARAGTQNEARAWAEALDIARAQTAFRQADRPRLRRRGLVYALIGAALFAAIGSVANDFASGAGVGVVLMLVLQLSAMDLDDCSVPDSSIWLVAVISALLTLFSGIYPTGSPHFSLVGFFLTSVLIATAVPLAKVMMKLRGRQAPGLVFGDGDVLLLLALSMLFGVDVLLVMAVACLVSMPLQVAPQFSQRIARSLGHFSHWSHGAPFIPGIFIGCALTYFAAARYDVSLNSFLQLLLVRMQALNH
jgi:hypothetical protein